MRRVRIEVAPEGDGEDVRAEHRRERDEAPVLREVSWTVRISTGSELTGETRIRTQSKPLNANCREEPEHTPVREPEERTRLP